MYVSPLQPITNAQVYVSGDVRIDGSAAIAPGAILQADPDSRIIIAAGVCIGMGTILHARQGTLEVEAGAVLGAGVLAIGTGKIGANACIGSGTTLLNPLIEPMQALPAGSLLGDTSRQVATTSSKETSSEPASGPVEPAMPQDVEQEAPAEPPMADPSNTPTIMYGQTHIHQLLVTLFPHRKPVNNTDQNGQVP